MFSVEPWDKFTDGFSPLYLYYRQLEVLQFTASSTIQLDDAVVEP